MVWWNLFRSDKIFTETVPDTQKCVIDLTPLTDLSDTCQQCADATTTCLNHPEHYDQVYITDFDVAYDWASKKCSFFRFWKFIYTYFRFIIDATNGIIPTWHFAFHFDDFIKKNKTIYVEDTLTIYCKSSESVDKLIPYITGSYSRLCLSGEITFNHVKLLWHDKLVKIYVAKPLDIKPEEYDEFVEFSLKHSRSFDSLFVYYIYNEHPDLKEKLTKTFEQNETHNFYPYSCNKPCYHHWWYVMHKGYCFYYNYITIGWVLTYFAINLTLFAVFWEQMPYLIVYMVPTLLATPFLLSFFRFAALPPQGNRS